MFPEHVERSFLDPEYSFAEYFQLGSRRNIRPIKNGLKQQDYRWTRRLTFEEVSLKVKVRIDVVQDPDTSPLQTFNFCLQI